MAGTACNACRLPCTLAPSLHGASTLETEKLLAINSAEIQATGPKKIHLRSCYRLFEPCLQTHQFSSSFANASYRIHQEYLGRTAAQQQLDYSNPININPAASSLLAHDLCHNCGPPTALLALLVGPCQLREKQTLLRKAAEGSQIAAS